ncbi:MAG: DUF1802 family protein [Longimicrobiaceae bacterium]
MLGENRSALKEWGAVERALAEGRTTLLVRKGGIHERREGFQVEHREFWIFPTLYHQNTHELRPEFRPALEAAAAAPHDVNRVRIGHYAVVEEALRVKSLDALRRLDGLHPLTPETVESRFAYRGKPYLHVLLVRFFRLPEPHVIPVTLDYEGCVSWVELDDALPTAGAQPVLLDGEFAARRADVLARLGEEDVVRL